MSELTIREFFKLYEKGLEKLTNGQDISNIIKDIWKDRLYDSISDRNVPWNIMFILYTLETTLKKIIYENIKDKDFKELCLKEYNEVLGKDKNL
jgi:hypothetical protein